MVDRAELVFEGVQHEALIGKKGGLHAVCLCKRMIDSAGSGVVSRMAVIGTAARS